MKTSIKIALLIAGYIALYCSLVCCVALLCGTFDLGFAYFGLNIPLSLVYVGVVSTVLPELN